MVMTFITLMIGSCGYRGETGTKELGVVMLVSKWKLLPPRNNLTFTGVLVIGLLSSAKERRTDLSSQAQTSCFVGDQLYELLNANFVPLTTEKALWRM